MTFLANPHFILQIFHAKTFKMKYTRIPYNNIIHENIHKVTKTDLMFGSNFYGSDVKYHLRISISKKHATRLIFFNEQKREKKEKDTNK